MAERDRNKWTRKELSLRLGTAELAAAVVEQWKKDGCPERDREAVEIWLGGIDYEKSSRG